MPSVGTENFITLRGEVLPKSAQSLEITRPNVDGVATKLVGTKGEQFQLVGVADVALGAPFATTLKTKMEAYMALAGTLVTVVDDHGVSWTNIHILRVARPRARAIVTSTGGLTGSGATHKITVFFTCIDTNA